MAGEPVVFKNLPVIKNAFDELEAIYENGEELQVMVDGALDDCEAQQYASRMASAICERAFNAHEIDSTHTDYTARMSMANSLAPHVELSLLPACRRNLQNNKISTRQDVYSNKVANYVYHGNGYLLHLGPVEEDGLTNAALSMGKNFFTIFGGKHHFVRPKIYSDATVTSAIAPLAKEAVNDVTKAYYI